MQSHALLLKLFYKNDDCAQVTLQKFQILKGLKKCFHVITALHLEKMIWKFENKGFFGVLPG